MAPKTTATKPMTARGDHNLFSGMVITTRTFGFGFGARVGDDVGGIRKGGLDVAVAAGLADQSFRIIGARRRNTSWLLWSCANLNIYLRARNFIVTIVFRIDWIIRNLSSTTTTGFFFDGCGGEPTLFFGSRRCNRRSSTNVRLVTNRTTLVFVLEGFLVVRSAVDNIGRCVFVTTRMSLGELQRMWGEGRHLLGLAITLLSSVCFVMPN